MKTRQSNKNYVFLLLTLDRLKLGHLGDDDTLKLRVRKYVKYIEHDATKDIRLHCTKPRGILVEGKENITTY